MRTQGLAAKAPLQWHASESDSQPISHTVLGVTMCSELQRQVPLAQGEMMHSEHQTQTDAMEKGAPRLKHTAMLGGGLATDAG